MNYLKSMWDWLTEVVEYPPEEEDNIDHFTNPNYLNNTSIIFSYEYENPKYENENPKYENRKRKRRDSSSDDIDNIKRPRENNNRIIKIEPLLPIRYNPSFSTIYISSNNIPITVQISRFKRLDLVIITSVKYIQKWKDVTTSLNAHIATVVSYESLRGTIINDPNTCLVRRINSDFIVTLYFQRLVERGCLLVFDDAIKVQNPNTAISSATTALSRYMVNEVQSGRSNSKTVLLFNSYPNSIISSISFFQLLGITYKSKLYDYNETAYKYTLTGLNDIIMWCEKINDNKTRDIYRRSRKGNYNLQYNTMAIELFKQVILPELITLSNL